VPNAHTTKPESRSTNPDRGDRRAPHQLRSGVSLEQSVEWAIEVPTAPREKLLLVAIAARPGAAASHLARCTGMTVPTVRESARDLLDDGWIYGTHDGGYLVDVAAEPMTELPGQDSPLGDQLARVLSRA
jgi:hypothetical protein